MNLFDCFHAFLDSTIDESSQDGDHTYSGPVVTNLDHFLNVTLGLGQEPGDMMLLEEIVDNNSHMSKAVGGNCGDTPGILTPKVSNKIKRCKKINQKGG